jgi:hypothetical protein
MLAIAAEVEKSLSPCEKRRLGTTQHRQCVLVVLLLCHLKQKLKTTRLKKSVLFTSRRRTKKREG